jgi:DNA repair protein SbcC/Rad50
MRLLELELENWGRHEKLKVDLSGGLQIGGRNGTGKSSILEAIRFIFSESGSGYKSKIRKGAECARVKIRLEKGKDVYGVEKRLYPKKASTAVMWVNRNPAADNAASVYNRLQEILPEDMLDKLMYVPQGTLTEIVSRLRLKGGRQELDRLFGLDKLEKVYKGISEELKVKEAEQEMLAKLLAKYPENAQATCEKEIAQIVSERKSLEKRMDEHKLNQKITDSKIDQLEKKIEEMRGVKKRKDEISFKLNQLAVKSASTGKEIESLRENMRLLEEKKAEINILVTSSEGLKKYPAIKDLLVRLAEDEKKIAALSGLPDKRKSFEETEKELNNKYGLEVEYEANTQKASKLRSDKEVKRQQLVDQKNYLKELASLSGRAKCPRCNQKLTESHVLEERKAAEDKVLSLDREIKELSAELLSCQGKAEAVKKVLDELVKKEIENKQRKLEVEKGAAEEDALRLDIKTIQEALSKEGYAGEPLKDVESRMKELSGIDARVNVYLEEIKKESHYSKELLAREELLARFSCEEKNFNSESAKLSYDDALLEDLRKRREGFIAVKSAASLETERANSQMREGQAKEAELSARKKEISEYKETDEALKKELGLLREARDIFHTDKGVVKYLREKYIRQLGILLTEHFRRINQNPKYTDIVFDQDYELEIRGSDGGFSVEQLSGGERVQIAIALRMALLELLSPMRLLMLDEPFGSLDKDHREALGESLNRIAGEGQLLIVTHIPVDSLQLPELDLGGY